jgi:hypothetical protein
MRKAICMLVVCVFLSVSADSHSQDSAQPVLELSGTVLSIKKAECTVYEKVRIGLSRTHTFKITDSTIFYGIVVPGVYVIVRYTQKMLRPGIFVRTAVEIKGYTQ